MRAYSDSETPCASNDAAMDGRTLRHRALADPSRVRVLERLGASEGPCSVDELAADVFLHPNTVRAHLDILVQAGFVVDSHEHRDRPGRPRRLFEAVPDEAEHEHTLLAAALAASLEPLPDGAALAAAAGRSWGHVLVERLEPDVTADEEATVGRVASLLRRRGFAPEVAVESLVMHRCPFRDLAERYPRVVCGMHAGLIDGALVELGAPVELDHLEPWVRSDACVAWLRPRTT